MTRIDEATHDLAIGTIDEAINYKPETIRTIRYPYRSGGGRTVFINGKPFPFHILEDGCRIITTPDRVTIVELQLFADFDATIRNDDGQLLLSDYGVCCTVCQATATKAVNNEGRCDNHAD